MAVFNLGEEVLVKGKVDAITTREEGTTYKVVLRIPKDKYDLNSVYVKGEHLMYDKGGEKV